MARILVLSIIVLIYGLLNYWIGMRMWQLLGKFIPNLPVGLYWSIFWFIVLSYIAGRFGERFLSPEIFRFLTILGSYWLAVMVYFAMVLGLLELVRFTYKHITFLPRGAFDQFPAAPLIGLGVVMIVLIIVIYGWLNARNPQVVHYDINIPKQAGNIKQLHVVAVSDLHLGNIVHNKRLNELVVIITKLNPDIILLPGDIVDENPLPFIEQNMEYTLRRLAPRYGIYAVPGNHEYIGGSWVEIISGLEKAGVKVLRDEVVKALA
ncbi:metallophosphoesterase [Desulfallas thermosapovorans]|uniref:Calcineurin-like phosphoesterase domain-containing protein n=1 Tax=Desulfallas thermosapovorans DSM 6562 TaxID=1121431 RepID=A0A5S4ZP05_9FIRM|nr:metallophosphoesterase [Desulfallas thermosapovorans]TYO94498.1 hypothetical protein LX24_02332 [Desulfallas thermosapovorans DSM 6562]